MSDTTATAESATASAAPDGTTTATTATTDSGATTASTTGEGAGGADTTTDTATTAGAPEAYAAFNVPEGYTLEGERLDALVAYGKANNLSQAAAQELVDRHIKLTEEAISNAREVKVDAWTAQSKQEFGNTFDTVAADARAGVKWAEQHRPNILKTFDDEGWGSNPDALWVFAKLGELTRGSKMEGLGNETADTPRPRSLEERLWGSKT